MKALSAIGDVLQQISLAGGSGLYTRLPEAWYFPATLPPKGKALIIAGIHGNEYSAKALGRDLVKRLPEERLQYNTLLLPAFSASTSRKGLRCRDLNREFGTGYQSKDPLARWLAELIQRWKPDRVLSIHADSIPSNAGIYTDPFRAAPDLDAFRRKLKSKALIKANGTMVYRWPEPADMQDSKICWGKSEVWVKYRGRKTLPLSAWADRAFFPSLKNAKDWAAAFAADERNTALITLAEEMIMSTSRPEVTCCGNLSIARRPAHLRSDGKKTSYSLLYPDQGMLKGGISLGEWCSAKGIAVITIEIPGKVAGSNWQDFIPAAMRFVC